MNQNQTQYHAKYHAYRTDPAVAAIVDTLVRMSLLTPHSPHEITMAIAATDFFVLGGAMVAHPSLISPHNNLPQVFFTVQADGSALFNGPLPSGKERVTVRSEDFILLKAPEGLKFPEGLEEKEYQPWVDAWKVEEARLMAFLNSTPA